ncbi:MAG: hypothetical protein ACI841_003345 [Planctomycetota bacterium]
MANSRVVRVFSGADGRVVFSLNRSNNTGRFGSSLASAGDLNGDGYAEFIVSAPYLSALGPTSQNGRVTLYQGGIQIRQLYCQDAETNSTGAAAHIELSGSSSMAANSLTLRGTQMSARRCGKFLVVSASGWTPFFAGSQRNLCLAAGQFGSVSTPAFKINVNGNVLRQIDLPWTSILAGNSRYLQCWFRDANPGPTSNISDAVELRLFWGASFSGYILVEGELARDWLARVINACARCSLLASYQAALGGGECLHSESLSRQSASFCDAKEQKVLPRKLTHLAIQDEAVRL